MQSTDQSITVQLSLRDNYVATLLTWIHPTGLLALLIVIPATVFLFGRAHGVPRFAWPIALVLTFILITLVIPLLTRIRNPSASAPIVHSFGADGITSKLLEGSITAGWALVKSAKETKNYIMVKPTRGSAAMLIPKRQLDSSQLTFVRNALSEYLPGKTRFWKTPNL